MQFDTPKLARPVRFAAVLMFAKSGKETRIAMYLDRISQAWGWKLGDRLWWRDRPNSTFVAALPEPEGGHWYAIEITDILEDWRLGRSVNNGLQLRPIGNDNYFNIFHSTRSPDLAKQPRLLVCT
jgi:hypothetical protein